MEEELFIALVAAVGLTLGILVGMAVVEWWYR